jgi:hypothetical protein
VLVGVPLASVVPKWHACANPVHSRSMSAAGRAHGCHRRCAWTSIRSWLMAQASNGVGVATTAGLGAYFNRMHVVRRPGTRHSATSSIAR